MAQLLEVAGVAVHRCAGVVCSALGNCSQCRGRLRFSITLTDTITGSAITLPVSALVVEVPYQLIIGRRTIRKYDLTRVLRSYFVEAPQPDRALLNALALTRVQSRS